MPPPPPPAPPPPPGGGLFSSAKTVKPAAVVDRSALLSDIQRGAKLKKAVTNDRSAPLVGNSNSSNSGSNRGPSSNNSNNHSSSNMTPIGKLGGLFAQGMPKLRSTGNNLISQQQNSSLRDSSDQPSPSLKSSSVTTSIRSITVSSSLGAQKSPSSSTSHTIKSSLEQQLSQSQVTTNHNNNMLKSPDKGSGIRYRTSSSTTPSQSKFNTISSTKVYGTSDSRISPGAVEHNKGRAPSVPSGNPPLPAKPVTRSHSQSAGVTRPSARPPPRPGPPSTKPPPPPKSINGPTPLTNKTTTTMANSGGISINGVSAWHQPSRSAGVPRDIGLSRVNEDDDIPPPLPSVPPPPLPSSGSPGSKPPPPPRSVATTTTVNGGLTAHSGTRSNSISVTSLLPSVNNNSSTMVGSTLGSSRGQSISSSSLTNTPGHHRPTAPPPPPPPSIHSRTASTASTVSNVSTATLTPSYPAPPPPPPGQQRTMRNTSISRGDLESRYEILFKDVVTLPIPEPMTKANKQYPSVVQQQKTRSAPPPPPNSSNNTLVNRGNRQQSSSSSHIKQSFMSNHSSSTAGASPMIHIQLQPNHHHSNFQSHTISHC